MGPSLRAVRGLGGRGGGRRGQGQQRSAVLPLKKSKSEEILENKSHESSMLSFFVVACVLPLISGQIPIPPRPDGFSLGSPSAAIVIDAHVDLLCPYCAQAHPTLSALTQHYTQVLLQPRRTHGIIAISLDFRSSCVSFTTPFRSPITATPFSVLK